MLASAATEAGGHGSLAFGVVDARQGLREAIRQSRVERQRFHAYLAWRMRKTAEGLRQELAATAA